MKIIFVVSQATKPASPKRAGFAGATKISLELVTHGARPKRQHWLSNMRNNLHGCLYCLNCFNEFHSLNTGLSQFFCSTRELVDAATKIANVDVHFHLHLYRVSHVCSPYP